MSTNPLSDRRNQAAHLLRRAGFGGTPAEIDELAKLSHVKAVEKLLDFRIDGNLAFNLERKLQENGYEAALNDIAYWWLLLMARSKQPLQEKMTLFWHGHFTSSFNKVRDSLLLLEQNQLFRDNALGNYRDFVKKVSRNPAMIDYLDGQSNRKGKPNENYARELMELFTIGIGNYTEQDVREAARAFTGWSFKDRTYVFNQNQHDTGSKTFMGQTGPFNGDDIIDIILKRQESGRFIINKLWTFFVYPNPEPAVLDRLGAVFFKSNFNLKEVMRAIFLAPEFLSEKAYRALVKSPVEYIIGMAKQLGATNIASNLTQASAAMGQTLFNPPTVKGWDGNLNWINSSFFFDRINTANNLANARNPQGNFRYDPYDLLGVKEANGPDSAGAVVDRFARIFLDGQLQPEIKSALTAYLNPSGTLKAADLLDAASGKQTARPVDSRVHGTLHLLMASPDYMLK
jgi:uncharacterized protein (DUF1800 family)